MPQVATNNYRSYCNHYLDNCFNFNRIDYSFNRSFDCRPNRNFNCYSHHNIDHFNCFGHIANHFACNFNRMLNCSSSHNFDHFGCNFDHNFDHTNLNSNHIDTINHSSNAVAVAATVATLDSTHSDHHPHHNSIAPFQLTLQDSHSHTF
jgi:hypothetical protein